VETAEQKKRAKSARSKKEQLDRSSIWEREGGGEFFRAEKRGEKKQNEMKRNGWGLVPALGHRRILTWGEEWLSTSPKREGVRSTILFRRIGKEEEEPVEARKGDGS